MKIVVGGAGTGKTTRISDDIISYSRQQEDEKKIYAISFTNNSRDNIKERLVNISTELSVSTIHSFLYRNVLKPYNKPLYFQHYHMLCNIDISGRYKGATLKRLSDQGILPNSEVFEKSKYIMCGKSNDKKAVREKRMKIFNILESYISAIFIDEAQDMDHNCIELFKELSSNTSIQIFLYGDYNQDLKGNKAFEQFIQTPTLDIEYQQESYRCPSKHLRVVNQIFRREEDLYSGNNLEGEIIFKYEKDIEDIPAYFDQFDLKYIFRKNSKSKIYTSTKVENDIIPYITEYLINVYNLVDNIDEIAYLIYYKSLKNKFILNQRIEYKGIGYCISPYNTGLADKARYYAYFKKWEDEVKNDVAESLGVQAKSIQAIKGLEGENTLFVVDNAIIKYLVDLDSENNKVKNALYVALTRSKNKMNILFLEECKSQDCKTVVEMIEQI